MSLDEIIAITPRLCHRRRGIGADGVLVINPSDIADYTMIYRNADGSDAGMCGNGGRCIALLANRLGYSAKHKFEVHGKTYQADVGDGEGISLHFPEISQIESTKTSSDIAVFKIYTGTEHVVISDPAVCHQSDAMLFKTGKTIRNDTAFAPAGTNVNFVLDHQSNSVTIKTYERGVENFTLACGTGAIASALAWHRLNQGGEGSFSCRVNNPGGPLTVSFRYDGNNQTYHDLVLTGSADFVFEGEFPL